MTFKIKSRGRGNFTTGAERYNKRMAKIFNGYRSIKEKESKMSYKELLADGYSKETAKYILSERKQMNKKSDIVFIVGKDGKKRWAWKTKKGAILGK